MKGKTITNTEPWLELVYFYLNLQLFQKPSRSLPTAQRDVPVSGAPIWMPPKVSLSWPDLPSGPSGFDSFPLQPGRRRTKIPAAQEQRAYDRRHRVAAWTAPRPAFYLPGLKGWRRLTWHLTTRFVHFYYFYQRLQSLAKSEILPA